MVAKIYKKASEWPLRRGGNGYMGISLGSHNHTGFGLKQMVEWIDRESGFSFIRIGLSDSLNRFSYKEDDGLTEAQAAQKAQILGNEWLNQNSSILTALNTPHEIIRWDHWERERPDAVAQNRVKFITLFRNNPDFRTAVLEDIDGFMSRRYGQNLTEPNGRSIAALNYIIEELSVYEEIYRDYPNTTIYPGKALKCVSLLREGKISSTFPLSRFERLHLQTHEPEQAFKMAV